MIKWGYKPVGNGGYDGTEDLEGRMTIRRNIRREFILVLDGASHNMGSLSGFGHSDAIIRRELKR